MFKVFLSYTLLLSSAYSYSECLSEHLQAAKDLNQERKALYSELSSGLSERISDYLIAEEKKLLRTAKVIENLLNYYHKNDIPIFCKEFIPMELAPEFSENLKESHPLSSFQAIDTPDLVTKLNTAFKKSNFNSLAKSVEKELIFFKDSPFNCMTKHLLESIGRTAYLASKYITAAKNKKLLNPKYIMSLSLKMQISSLERVAKIDLWAAPIQARGIPIICNDVPHIPLHSSWGDNL